MLPKVAKKTVPLTRTGKLTFFNKLNCLKSFSKFEFIFVISAFSESTLFLVASPFLPALLVLPWAVDWVTFIVALLKRLIQLFADSAFWAVYHLLTLPFLLLVPTHSVPGFWSLLPSHCSVSTGLWWLTCCCIWLCQTSDLLHNQFKSLFPICLAMHSVRTLSVWWVFIRIFPSIFSNHLLFLKIYFFSFSIGSEASWTLRSTNTMDFSTVCT